MSTGHWFTQAPQLVQDHSTSGSMTPYDASSAISGRAASAFTDSDRPSRSSSEARMYGALANAWSRRSRISIFGESGFSVFHAGHCDWQRPHSVQVAKSSRPFHVKSSTAPTPSLEFSSRSSRSSRVTGLPFAFIGTTAPRAWG